jgi:hypothetical protein
VVSFTPRLLHPQGKSPRYPLDRRLGGPQSRSRRGGEENFQLRSNSFVLRDICTIFDNVIFIEGSLLMILITNNNKNMIKFEESNLLSSI